MMAADYGTPSIPSDGKGDGMPRKFQELRAKMSPESRTRVEARVHATTKKGMSLRELRDSCEVTQQELAKRIDSNQSELSKLEGRTDCLISTIREYLDGLGAELDLVARFRDGGEVRIRQFTDVPLPEKVGAGR